MINLVVIDLGSNSVRMQITEIDQDNHYTVKGYYREYVRLSENMGPEKTLKPDPMKRTIKVLQGFKKKYDQLDHVVIKTVATAAVRQAKNQKDFLDMVEKATGIKLNVISGETEAYLDYLGVISTLPIKNGLIMDTGGASTELIWLKNGSCHERISIPIGAVLLSQRYNLTDSIAAADLYQAMNAAGKLFSSIKWMNEVHDLPLIALGGSNRTIAKIQLSKLKGKFNENRDIFGMQLSAQHVFDLFQKLLSMNREERMAIPGLGTVRADVIVGGLIPICLALCNLQSPEVVFANHGLRDGLLYEYLQERNGGSNLNDKRK